MAITKTEIINRALILIGSRTIVNLNDNTPEANAANKIYPIALQSILSETLWTFAIKRAMLATTLEPIAFTRTGEDVTISYQRPVDALRVFETNILRAIWFEEGDQILSDTLDLGVRYVYLNENTATYPTYFIEALSDKLAADLAFNLLNSRSKSEALTDRYERISLPKATSMNAQIGTAKTMIDDLWINSRYTGPNVKEF